MTNDEAMQLAKQGFTADEIRALGWSASETPEENTEPILEEENVPEDNKKAILPEEVTETIKGLTETVASLSETVKAMQESNQKKAKTPASNNPKSADEVIRGFIEKM